MDTDRFDGAADVTSPWIPACAGMTPVFGNPIDTDEEPTA